MPHSSQGPDPPPAPNSTSRGQSRKSNGAKYQFKIWEWDPDQESSVYWNYLCDLCEDMTLAYCFTLHSDKSASVDHPSPGAHVAAYMQRVKSYRDANCTFQLLYYQLYHLVTLHFKALDSHTYNGNHKHKESVFV